MITVSYTRFWILGEEIVNEFVVVGLWSVIGNFNGAIDNFEETLLVSMLSAIYLLPAGPKSEKRSVMVG